MDAGAILRIYPTLPSAARIRAALEESLTKVHVAAELAYFQSLGRGRLSVRMAGDGCSLSRPNCARGATRDPTVVAGNPPARGIHRGGLLRLPPAVAIPGPDGCAFQHRLRLDAGAGLREGGANRRLEAAIVSRSREFYGADGDAPVGWEPGGEDFLSPSLTEADLMSRVLPAAEFRRWLVRFLPGLAEGEPCALTEPPRVYDRRDGNRCTLTASA